MATYDRDGVIEYAKRGAIPTTPIIPSMTVPVAIPTAPISSLSACTKAAASP